MVSAHSLAQVANFLFQMPTPSSRDISMQKRITLQQYMLAVRFHAQCSSQTMNLLSQICDCDIAKRPLFLS